MPGGTNKNEKNELLIISSFDRTRCNVGELRITQNIQQISILLCEQLSNGKFLQAAGLLL